jgi:hypothetical protein
MTILRQLLDAILELLGLKPKAGAKKSLPAKGATPAPGKRAAAPPPPPEEEPEEEPEPESGLRVVESRDGADLIEDDEELRWVSRVDTDVPRASWRDVWGPLRGKGPKTLEDFCFHQFVFDQAQATDPRLAERKLQEFGYRDVGQWYRVLATVGTHLGTPHGPNVGDFTFGSQDYLNAVRKASARARGEDHQARVAGDPGLLAPIEGVTVETYARIAARQAQGLDAAGLAALVAQHGLDLATWDRASAGWNDRMSKDTTATIATIYGQAFLGAGQGQFGGAAQAVSNHAYSGAAASGEAPMAFGDMCEIQGAIQAWSATGQDVNGMLASTFRMNAAEFAAVHTWWLTQLAADVSKFETYNARVQAAQRKYEGGGAKAGSDVDF